jgi:hypothetical protein
MMSPDCRGKVKAVCADRGALSALGVGTVVLCASLVELGCGVVGCWWHELNQLGQRFNWCAR